MNIIYEISILTGIVTLTTGCFALILIAFFSAELPDPVEEFINDYPAITMLSLVIVYSVIFSQLLYTLILARI